MKQPIYMIVGCPGSGKTWVTNQIKHKFEFVHHDLFIGQAGDAYVKSILAAAEKATKPLLIEAPFSLSQILQPITKAGYKVTPLVIVEADCVVRERYWRREKKLIPAGHLTRMRTYLARANEHGWFKGTSDQVLQKLKEI